MSYGHRADSTLSCGQRTDSTLSCGQRTDSTLSCGQRADSTLSCGQRADSTLSCGQRTDSTLSCGQRADSTLSCGQRTDSTLSCGQRTDSTLSCGPPAKPLSCPTSQFGEVAAHVQQTEAFCQRAAVLLVQLQLPTSGLFPRFTAAVRRAVFRPAGKGRDDRQMGNVRTDTQTHRLGRSAKGG